MRSFWITFVDGAQACVEAVDQAAAEAKAAEVAGKAVKTVMPLPYPANPVIGERSGTPAFCFKPNECAGHGACPRRRSCDE